MCSSDPIAFGWSERGGQKFKASGADGQAIDVQSGHAVPHRQSHVFPDRRGQAVRGQNLERSVPTDLRAIAEPRIGRIAIVRSEIEVVGRTRTKVEQGGAGRIRAKLQSDAITVTDSRLLITSAGNRTN